MSGAVGIERIGRDKASLSRFFDVADRLYAADPCWVAPLRDDLAKVFRDENPFFRHGEMQLFVARRDGKDVGRIAAVLDRNHNEFHEQCVERIFTDVMRMCKPVKLAVYARYTRRGGLDINPFRTNYNLPMPDNMRLARQ